MKQKHIPILIMLGLLALLAVYQLEPRIKIVTIGVTHSDPYTEEEITSIISIAEDRINAYTHQNKSPYKFRFEIQYVPMILGAETQAVEHYIQNNVHLIIGHDYSSQCRRTITNIPELDYIMISPYSSDLELTQKTHNLFRLRTNDTYQGFMITQILKEKNIFKPYLLYINNSWGNIMLDAVTKYCRVYNIEIQKTLAYNEINEDLLTEIMKIENELDEASTNREHTGIITLSLLEITDIINQIERNSSLFKIPWFTTEAVTFRSFTPVFEDNPSENYQQIELYCPKLRPVTANHPGVEESYYALTGSKLDYTQAARYDAAWIYALSVISEGTIDIHQISKVIPIVSADYIGLLGVCKFNSHNDKLSADYNIVRYNHVDNSFIDVTLVT